MVGQLSGAIGFDSRILFTLVPLQTDYHNNNTASTPTFRHTTIAISHTTDCVENFQPSYSPILLLMTSLNKTET